MAEPDQRGDSIDYLVHLRRMLEKAYQARELMRKAARRQKYVNHEEKTQPCSYEAGDLDDLNLLIQVDAKANATLYGCFETLVG